MAWKLLQVKQHTNKKIQEGEGYDSFIATTP
jgi:hypothetical protein